MKSIRNGELPSTANRRAPMLAAGLFALAAGLLPAPSQAEALKIGLSLPLSGSATTLGKQFLDGARLALADSGKEGMVEIIAADDGCEAETAARAALTLASAAITLAGGFLCNEAVPPAAAALSGSGVPLVLSGARSGLLLKDATEEGWKLFRIAPSDSRQGEAAFEFLAPRWRDLAWAVIDDGTVFGRTLADDFRARMEEAGHPPLFADNFRPAQSTQASLVRRIQKAGVTAAFVAGDADDVAIIWGNIREAGLAIEVAGGESLALLPYSARRETLAPGLLAVIEPDPGSANAAGPLITRLAEEGRPAEPFFLAGYAAMQVALAAIAPTPQETATRLGNGVFQTVLGPVSFGEGGQNFHDGYALVTWTGNAFEPTPGLDR